MRLVRPTGVLVAAVLSLAFAPVVEDVPAGYAHPDPDVEVFFAEQATWFTATTARVGNLDHENGEWIGWSTAEPTDPVGGATAAASYGGFREIFEDQGQDKGQFTAEGTFTGHLDSMTLDLHFVDPYLGSLCDLNLAVDLDVDGVPVLDMDGTGGVVPVATEPAGDTAADGWVARLKLTDIDAQLRRFSSDGFDLVGDETTEHEVHLSVQMFPLCNEVVWRYGTSAAPSSLVFNRDPADPSVAGHTTFSVIDPPTDG